MYNLFDPEVVTVGVPVVEAGVIPEENCSTTTPEPPAPGCAPDPAAQPEPPPPPPVLVVPLDQIGRAHV